MEIRFAFDFNCSYSLRDLRDAQNIFSYFRNEFKQSKPEITKVDFVCLRRQT